MKVVAVPRGNLRGRINMTDRSLLAAVVTAAVVSASVHAQEPASTADWDGEAGPGGLLEGVPCPPGCSELINQPPVGSTLVFSDSDCDSCGTGQQSLAEDLVLTQEQLLCDIIIWGGYFAGDSAPTDVFTVIIHADSAGLPDSVVYAETGVASSRVDTGSTAPGVTLYEYTLTLSAPPVLPPGTYWIEIFNDTTGNPDTWGWLDSTVDPVGGRPGIVFDDETPGVAWNSVDGFPLAMLVCGKDAVPNPAEIPTVTEWGLIVLALLMLTAGTIIIRREMVLRSAP